MSTSQKWRLSQLVHIPLLFFATGGGIEPPMVIYLQGQNLVTLPNSSTPQFKRRDEVPTPIPFSTCRFQDGVTSRCDYLSLFMKPICQRTFSFEVPVRFELTTPGYKAGVLPNYTKEPNFLGIKKPELVFSSGLIFLLYF